jgi:hypothetical protein
VAAAKKRKLALEVRKQEALVAPLLIERDAAEAELEKAEEKMHAAREELNAVQLRYHEAFHRVLDGQSRIKRARRELESQQS